MDSIGTSNVFHYLLSLAAIFSVQYFTFAHMQSFTLAHTKPQWPVPIWLWFQRCRQSWHHYDSRILVSGPEQNGQIFLTYILPCLSFILIKNSPSFFARFFHECPIHNELALVKVMVVCRAENKNQSWPSSPAHTQCNGIYAILKDEEPNHHDDVIKWNHFPCYWPFVRGIRRSPVNFPHKGQC